MRAWYMNGAGNDFVVIDGRGLDLDLSALAKRACALKGADGFMALDDSDVADFRLHLYNADGSRGEMCGNGARCICRFGCELGVAGPEMTVQTDAGIVKGWRLERDRYRVALNLPGVVDLGRKPDAAYVELGDPGVPHAVKEVPDLDRSRREELRDMARRLRHDPAFPKGANANLYALIGPDRVRILTYERGVEDFTLACGTGSASTALVLWLQGRCGDRVSVENPGGTLTVTMEGPREDLRRLTLEGPAMLTERFEL